MPPASEINISSGFVCVNLNDVCRFPPENSSLPVQKTLRYPPAGTTPPVTKFFKGFVTLSDKYHPVISTSVPPVL